MALPAIGEDTLPDPFIIPGNETTIPENPEMTLKEEASKGVKH